MMAKSKKESIERKAHEAEKVAHVDTELAARDAAEVDARVKAASLVAERTREAHYLAGRAEADWQKAENVRESILERGEREKAGGVRARAGAVPIVNAAGLVPASELIRAGAGGGPLDATAGIKDEENLDTLSTKSIASSSIGGGNSRDLSNFSSLPLPGQSPAVPSMSMGDFVGGQQQPSSSSAAPVSK
jgi:hypothetical protein